jgi:hypothetical protein
MKTEMVWFLPTPLFFCKNKRKTLAIFQKQSAALMARIWSTWVFQNLRFLTTFERLHRSRRKEGARSVLHLRIFVLDPEPNRRKRIISGLVAMIL